MGKENNKRSYGLLLLLGAIIMISIVSGSLVNDINEEICDWDNINNGSVMGIIGINGSWYCGNLLNQNLFNVTVNNITNIITNYSEYAGNLVNGENTYVPYSGATDNLDLGDNNFFSGYNITFGDGKWTSGNYYYLLFDSIPILRAKGGIAESYTFMQEMGFNEDISMGGNDILNLNSLTLNDLFIKQDVIVNGNQTLIHNATIGSPTEIVIGDGYCSVGELCSDSPYDCEDYDTPDCSGITSLCTQFMGVPSCSSGSGLPPMPLGGNLKVVNNGTIDGYAYINGSEPIGWNSDEFTIEVPTGIGDSTRQLGAELMRIRKNGAGVTIYNGMLVYSKTAQGERIQVGIADANASYSKIDNIGIVTAESCRANADCPITYFGDIHGLDLSDYAEGDSLFLKCDGSGNFTNEMQTDSCYNINIGKVKSNSSTNGILDLHIQEIDIADNPVMQNLTILGVIELNGTRLKDWQQINQSGGDTFIYSQYFDQYLNTSNNVEFKNLTIENMNLSKNLLSYTQRDVESSEFDLSGSGNIFSVLTRCPYESTPPLCDFLDGVGGILNVTGSSNIGSLEMTQQTTVYTQKINGFANLFGGYFSAGSSEVNGSGNIVWGTGLFKVSETAYGNLIVGNNLEVTGTAEGSLVVGQLNKVTGKYCTAVGAQNECYAAYGSAIGYQNEVTGTAGTATALGRGNTVNAIFSGALGYFNYQGGQQSYSFGRYVNETENFFVTIGNGKFGEPSRDIRISQGDAGNITINKETYFNTNITADNYYAGNGNQGLTAQLNISGGTCNITYTNGLMTGFSGCN